MLLFQRMTRSLILLLFIIIGSLLDPAVIHFIDTLNVIVIIAVTDSFLLHAAINRFDSLCMNVSITTDGSFIVEVNLLVRLDQYYALR